MLRQTKSGVLVVFLKRWLSWWHKPPLYRIYCSKRRENNRKSPLLPAARDMRKNKKRGTLYSILGFWRTSALWRWFSRGAAQKSIDLSSKADWLQRYGSHLQCMHTHCATQEVLFLISIYYTLVSDHIIDFVKYCTVVVWARISPNFGTTVLHKSPLLLLLCSRTETGSVQKLNLKKRQFPKFRLIRALTTTVQWRIWLMYCGWNKVIFYFHGHK